MRAATSPPLVITAVLALVAGAGDLLRAQARRAAPSAVDAILEPPALPAAAVRLMSLGFQSAAADVSYLGAIQIFGDPSFGKVPLPERIQRSRALARLLEYSTDLDPPFAYAYVFGAVTIPVPVPDRPTANVDEAVHLLRKGVDAVPDDWRVPFHLGYLLAREKHDFAGAAVAMGAAARRPGHPEYLPLLATRLAAHGGAVETGLDLARAMLANAETDEQRAELRERVLLLVMEQQLRALEQAAERFRTREGRFPPDPAALVAAGDLAAVPEEPHGGAYAFDPASGTARSTAAARLRVFDSDTPSGARATTQEEPHQ